MKGQLHFISSEDPIQHWGDTKHGLCGEPVEKAVAKMTVDLDAGSFSMPGNSLLFCPECWIKAWAHMPGRRFIYGIAPGQEVLDEV